MRLLNVTLVVVASVASCLGQPGRPAEQSSPTNNPGRTSNGIQVSVSSTNTVWPAGATATFLIQIRNSSKDTAQAEPSPATSEPGGLPGPHVFLVNGTGQSHALTPEPPEWTGGRPPPLTVIGSPPPLLPIGPGESRAWTFPVSVGRDVEPGDYTLRVRQYFYVPEGNQHVWVQVEADRVQVKVVPGDPPGQANQPANWGMAEEGLQISVSSTNGVLVAGTNAVLVIQFRNLSEEAVGAAPSLQAGEPEGLPGPEISLLSRGKDYRLTPRFRPVTNAPPQIPLASGETRAWTLPVSVGRDTDPGEVHTSRSFSILP